MGPMGSMMGGSLGTFGWPVLVLPVVLFALVLGAVTFAFLTARGGSEPRRQASPEETPA